MLLGTGVERVSPAAGTASLPWIEPIGLLWLNALKMTIVPLIVALLITGITATADAARAGTLAFRAVMTFLGAIFFSGLMSLLMTPLLLRRRSEEHTSELQSLMRILYAVFCLKKKNNLNTVTHETLVYQFMNSTQQY